MAKRVQKHGRIVHQLNDHEAVVWDATDISPEVAARFRGVLVRRMVANNKILKRLGLAKDTGPELEDSTAKQVA